MAPWIDCRRKYFRTNIAITTSGVNWHEGLQFAHRTVGADDIMFAIDYPYERPAQSRSFAHEVLKPVAISNPRPSPPDCSLQVKSLRWRYGNPLGKNGNAADYIFVLKKIISWVRENFGS